MGGGDGTNPKVWDDGKIADWVSHAVTVSFFRHRQAELMMRIASEFGFTPCKPQPNIGAAVRSAVATGPDGG
jgi:hypothetical protein